jgi:hypothetical protein
MFMIISGMLIMIIFMALFSEIYQDNITNRKTRLFEDYAYGLQTEFILASQVAPGYRRAFVVPERLEGFAFEAYLSNSMVIVNYSDNMFALPIPNVTGVLVKGRNIIVNNDNEIKLN